MSAWVGLMAPAATPRPIVKKLAAEIERIVVDPDVQKTLLRSGAEPVGYYLDAFGAYIRDETARYGKVIAASHIRAD
ncbi:tripartite tricarboxylate transporter substrate-binding protein [Cupriavidus basilensis]